MAPTSRSAVRRRCGAGGDLAAPAEPDAALRAAAHPVRRRRGRRPSASPSVIGATRLETTTSRDTVRPLPADSGWMPAPCAACAAGRDRGRDAPPVRSGEPSSMMRPRSITMMRSKLRSVDSRCAMAITVRPRISRSSADWIASSDSRCPARWSPRPAAGSARPSAARGQSRGAGAGRRTASRRGRRRWWRSLRAAPR